MRWAGAELHDAAGVAVWAPILYEGPARALVAGLKFSGAMALADEMAAAVAAGAPPGVLEGALVPVPLSTARRRERGYNQAERLAVALGRRTALPVEAVLRRRGRAGRQLGRSRRERLTIPAETVQVAGSHGAPRRAVLVDDVITTGGTLAVCAHALRRAGAVEVAAVAYARTPGR
ncbi:MAG: hypothetical protein M3350_09005 [Actinomycetota bacterium]|nr:hypothetical protein [Actinomycetota bacterium]